MNVVQKLILDKELTTNAQLIVRDETGTYSPSNINGYGGGNGDDITKFEKYIFDLTNLSTNNKYKQIQSNYINGVDFVNPSILKIVNKENVIINADTFDILIFEDGIYKLNMSLQINDAYNGNGVINTEVAFNVAGAQSIYDNYDGIIADGEVYFVQGVTGTNLVLDRAIVKTFNSFKPMIATSINFIISDELNDCIDTAIASLSKICDRKQVVDTTNLLSEIQIYQWGIKRCIDKGDIDQAYSYFKMAKDLCNSKCNCNGR